MYKVLLVFKDENISEKIKRMNIWGENSEFEISAVAKDGAAAYDEVKKQHYDLAVMQTDIDGMDGLQLLRHIRGERLFYCRWFRLSAPLCQAYHLHSYKFLVIKNFHTKNRHLRRFKNCIFLFFCNHNLIFIAV